MFDDIEDNIEMLKFTCLNCTYHMFSDMYLECQLHERINDTNICIDFTKEETNG